MKNARPPIFKRTWGPTAADRLVDFRKQQEKLRGSPAHSAQARGYDRDWHKLRNAILAEEPLCRECARRGIERAAQMVDHIVSIHRAPELRLDRSNAQPLCWPCHHKKTNRYDGGFGHYARKSGSGKPV